MKTYPLVVIGAGAAGLVIAIGAAKAGKKVLLIEKGTYGGDCTNFGCIPSKSLIASAHAAHAIKSAKLLGVELTSSHFHADKALDRVRQIVEEVRSHEDPKALAKAGVETITGSAHFIDPHTIQVNDQIISAKRIVIATGSTPLIPEIPGLKNTPFLTNETIFDLQTIPKSLAVIGGGPIGCELAQAFQRLGSQVSLIHTHEKLLNKEDPLAQYLIAKQFSEEGVFLHLGMEIQEVTHQKGQFHIRLDKGSPISAEQILVSVGRRPNISSLKLEAAGITFSDRGIAVDAYGQTSKRHIWAIGDVIGPPFFTHWAESQARSVLTSILLPFSFKTRKIIPRVTFTDPEVASVGPSEEEAAKSTNIATYFIPFTSVDRAITEGREGFVKIITKKWSGQILGCTIVGPRAGEMLSQITTAMQNKIPLRKLSSLIHAYPTYSQAIRKAADLWLTQTILGAFKRKS